jgi:8-oxo-(d)GTP phosphatase
MADPDLVVAAGAVTVRRRRGATEVLLVHRPRYDDWSFPKGKLDPGEDVRTCAVREVEEETGLTVRLGPPLAPQVYAVGTGTVRAKVVHYWIGRCTGDEDLSTFRPDDEVDQVRWVRAEKAPRLLDYSRDVDLLAEAVTYERTSVPVLVLRHSEAAPRKKWRGDDRRRPLSDAGEEQARSLVPLLSAYGVRLVVASSSDRCAQTVAPYAEEAGRRVELVDALSEEDATTGSVRKVMRRVLAARRPAVVCGHRPVLPDMLAALGLARVPLTPGAAAVLHHRRGRVVALERVEAPQV